MKERDNEPIDETGSHPPDIHRWGSTSLQLFAMSCLIQLPFLLLLIAVIREPRAAQGAATIGGCFFCSGTLVNLIGAVYGLAGIFQRHRMRSLAIWGLVLNIILPIIMYLVALAVMPPNP